MTVENERFLQMKRFLWILLLVLLVPSARAQDLGGFPLPGDFPAPVGPESARYLSLRAISSHEQVQPGETFHVALEMTLAEGWVYYGPLTPEPYKPARIDVAAPESLRIGETQWGAMTPKSAPLGDGSSVVILSYVDHTVAYVPVTVADDAEPGEVELVLTPQGQICGNQCIDIQPAFEQTRLQATATVRIGPEPKGNPAWASSPSLPAGLDASRTAADLAATEVSTSGMNQPVSDMTFWAAVVVALIAGLTLNIMPCVLPVIPLRILSLVEMAGESRRKYVTLGLAFALGMMLFFIAIAGVNLAAKELYGRGFDLNAQFQQPGIIIGMAMVLVALAANLFGVFNVVVPGNIASLEQNVQSRQGHARSLGMGFMMGVLSTPCSFAFLLSAMTYAQGAGRLEGTVVILSIGLGMSAPHVLLSAFPGLLKYLPRPGRWMELFKQSCGFILLLVVVWLVSTLGGEGSGYAFWVVAWAVVLVMCLWIWANWVRYDAPWKRKLLVRGLAVAVAVSSGVWMLSPPGPPMIPYESFDQAQIQRLREQGDIVVVKFTAGWCGKCIEQDTTIFANEDVAEAFRETGAVLFRGDVGTKARPAAQWMHRNGYGSAIPLTLVYHGKSEPIELRDMTAGEMVAALHEADRQPGGEAVLSTTVDD